MDFIPNAEHRWPAGSVTISPAMIGPAGDPPPRLGRGGAHRARLLPRPRFMPNIMKKAQAQQLSKFDSLRLEALNRRLAQCLPA